ncbi:acetyl-CoA carboxylase biotin carboxyl carrier protein [Psychrobacter sp. FDAARGOS_221]|uniref:acetyl-CoA carboxylase biotin carboxyl carrier protein n=1 Tax=Psychrobacter sp. FDAARGOS_221 TaxID=1975705 RepID=UPI000BB559E4|nr:biotin/lipoyl-containing protein [Psychrobacter sp. FDAARGOS_221]PNK60911.1 hypothetical protein A6J60_008485 [Psychrobacter sp. FDAARGOS_221]
MDIEIIEKLVQRVERSHVQQVTVADGAKSITVVNRLAGQPMSAAQTASQSSKASNLANDNANKPADSAAAIISAPYVGYIQFSPDGGPELLVEVGDNIEVGQTVAYIDVLSKLMPVESKIAGTVDEILAETGDGVEYGQPLIKLK